MTLSFTEAVRPTVTRKSEPNPFTPLAEALAGDFTKTLSFSVEIAGDDADRFVAKVKRQIASAAEPFDVTIRSTVAIAPAKGKAPAVATFTAWATAAIVRKPRATVAPSGE